MTFKLKALLVAVLTTGAFSVSAELRPFEDYDISDAVWQISTIKVASNATDHYLAGLKATWVRGQEAAKKLGHIEDYAIYTSITGESGDFNLMLVTKFSNLAATGPSKARLDALIKELGESTFEESNKRALETYPELREITGDYIMHEITIK